MSTALRRGNVIYKTVGALIVGIVMLDCHFHPHAVLFSFAVDNFGVQRCFSGIQVGDKFFYAALVVEGSLLFFFRALVKERNFQVSRQKCGFPQPQATLFP